MSDDSGKPFAKLNKALLLQVKGQILAEPRLFQMGTWARKTECGTACCIAGWAFTLLAREKDIVPVPRFFGDGDGCFYDLVDDMDWCYWTEKRLGLTPAEADRVFHVTHWPPEFRGAFRDARGDEARAGVAAAYIDWLCGEEVA